MEREITQRQIKFRAWDGRLKNMFQDVAWVPRRKSATREWIFMQYIGIKDKNGNEIFEGDILKFDTWSRTNVLEVVEFESAGYNPFCDPSYCDDEQGDHFKGEFEIIGNIYEHPELLTPKGNTWTLTQVEHKKENPLDNGTRKQNSAKN